MEFMKLKRGFGQSMRDLGGSGFGQSMRDFGGSIRGVDIGEGFKGARRSLAASIANTTGRQIDTVGENETTTTPFTPITTNTTLMTPEEILMSDVKSPFNVPKTKRKSTTNNNSERSQISTFGGDTSRVSMAALDGMEKLNELNAMAELAKEVRQLQEELVDLYTAGQNKQRRNRQECKAYSKIKSSIARSLWLKRKNHVRNPFASMELYKNTIFRCSLPCHDMSPATIANEAKLLKINCDTRILIHQLDIMKERQQEVIDFFYKKVLPRAQRDHKKSTKALRKRVDAATKRRDDMVELYEQRLMLQRKIISKLKLRQLEVDNISVDSTEFEALKVAAGDTKAFEKDPQLRGSAERRIEERKIAMQKRQEKKKARDEVSKKRMESVDAMEKAALKRAEEVSSEVNSLLSSLQQEVASFDSLDFDSLDEDEVAAIKKRRSSVNSAGVPVNLEFVSQDSQTTLKAGHIPEHANEDGHGGDNDDNDDDSMYSSGVTQEKKSLGTSNDQQQQLTEAVDKPNESETTKKEKKADISARLEALRAKRKQSVETRNAVAARNENKARGKSPTPTPRRDLLERARSARQTSTRDLSETTENKESKLPSQEGPTTGADPETTGLSSTGRKISDDRLAAIRERRRARATAAGGS